MGYVPLKEVTALAQTVVKEADDRDRNIWGAWVYQALLQLGVSDEEIKVMEIEPEEGVAILPPDCKHIIEVSLFDSAGCQLRHSFRGGKQRIFRDTRIAPVATTGTDDINQFVPVDVSANATNIYLGTNGENVSKIELRYFAYPVDESGDLLIRDEDMMACVHFIRYMQGLRNDDNRSKIAQDEQTWKIEADRSRARKKMTSMSPDKARSLMTSLVSLLPNFRTVQGF